MKRLNKQLPENKLAVVVARASGLRNVLKLDKQSPFVTIRLQDQETSTRVLPRGGQNPRWDEAHWLSLDGVDLGQEKNRKVVINVYHQKKGDAKLICSSDIDYTPALTKSIQDGYDAWFELYWDGKVAGKIYLEFTFYPKLGDVPIGTESLGRSSNKKIKQQTPGVRKSIMEGKSVVRSDELPVLDNGFEPSSSDEDHNDKDDEYKHTMSKTAKSNSPESPSEEKGLFHFLDKKLQNLAGRFGGGANGANTTSNSYDPWLNLGESEDVKRKMQSPQLINKAPSNLFGDIPLSDEDDDERDALHERELNTRLNGMRLDARNSIAKRQERIFKEGSVQVSDNDEDDDDDNSYHIRSESSDEDGDLPPPPPKHIIPTNSFRDSTTKSRKDEKPVANRQEEDLSGLSWYERRMRSRRPQ